MKEIIIVFEWMMNVNELDEKYYHCIWMNDDCTWIGCIPFLLLPKPSTVVMSQPSQLKMGVTHWKLKSIYLPTHVNMLICKKEKQVN